MAQTPARVPVIGVLAPGPSPRSAPDLSAVALEEGLKERGWTPGRTVRIDVRYADGEAGRLRDHAHDLVRQKVDVIVARAVPPIRAAQQATATIPIVMSGAGQDPVRLGLVASLARPEANITGLTLLSQDLLAKQLQVLKEVVPRLSRVTVLGSRSSPLAPKLRKDVDLAGEALGVQVQHLDIAAAADIERAFEDMTRAKTGGVVVRGDAFILEAHVPRVAALTVKHRLPAIFWLDVYTEAGGLMAYGADLLDVHRRSAFYVDRLLRGARPGDLPIEEPSRLSLVLNLKTAQAIGLTVPPAVLAQASEVIQ